MLSLPFSSRGISQLFHSAQMAQQVKNPPAVKETEAQSLCQEDPLEQTMATHFSILAWEIPWTEELDRLQSMQSQRVRHD